MNDKVARTGRCARPINLYVGNQELNVPHSKVPGVPFDVIASLATPVLRPVCVALREQILRLDAGATEICWPRLKIASFGIGPSKKSQHYAYISVHRDHINLGIYHGASLQGAGIALEGSGKHLRHVKLHEHKDVTDPAIGKLLRAAISERRKNAPLSNERLERVGMDRMSVDLAAERRRSTPK